MLMAVVLSTSAQKRSGGVLLSVVQALGTVFCTLVILRLHGVSMFVQTALVSVVSGT